MTRKAPKMYGTTLGVQWERVSAGLLCFGIAPNGYLVQRIYNGYTLTESVKMFRAELRTLG